MKKLNKSELEAVARDICKNVNKERMDARELADKKYLPTATKIAQDILEELTTLSEELTDYLDILDINDPTKFNVSEDSLVAVLTRKNRKQERGYMREYDVIDSLVIAQIDADSLKDLINTVTKQLTTTP